MHGKLSLWNTQFWVFLCLHNNFFFFAFCVQKKGREKCDLLYTSLWEIWKTVSHKPKTTWPVVLLWDQRLWKGEKLLLLSNWLKLWKIATENIKFLMFYYLLRRKILIYEKDSVDFIVSDIYEILSCPFWPGYVHHMSYSDRSSKNTCYKCRFYKFSISNGLTSLGYLLYICADKWDVCGYISIWWLFDVYCIYQKHFARLYLLHDWGRW